MSNHTVKLSDKQLDYLVKHFKCMDNEYLCMQLGISVGTLYKFVHRFGLKKSRAHKRQMAYEASMAARASHIKHGTHPPKGYRIPRSEEFCFKPGVKSVDRWGRKKERERIQHAVEGRRQTYINEKMRVMRGLPQQTKLKIRSQPRQLIVDRAYLKSRGYILDEEKKIAYWTDTTRRAKQLESKPVRYYSFAKYEEGHE